MSLEFAMFAIDATDKEFKDATETYILKGDTVSVKLLKPGQGADTFEDSMASGRLFGIPDVKGMGWKKSFIECCVNTLQALGNAFSKHCTRLDGETTDDGLPIELRNQVAQIANTLQWIINSTSWRDGVYHTFDAFEISQKLKYCSVYGELALHKKGKFPSFEVIEIDMIKKGEKSLLTRESLGALINTAIAELDYEPRFFYTFDGRFSLYRREQLR